MRGKFLIIGLILFLIIFGAGLYYSINYAYYTKSEADLYDLQTKNGVLTLKNAEILDANTSPLKIRICADEFEPIDLEVAAEATPLVTVDWFKCFDAGKLQAALDNKETNARIISDNVPWGFDLYGMNYQGRSYFWRQLNACGDAKFSGEELPGFCPVEEEYTEAEE